MHSVVVALGDGAVAAAGAQAHELHAAGLTGMVAVGPAPADVGHDLLAVWDRSVDPGWVGHDGRTLSAYQAARLLGHEAAWQQVVLLGEPVVVLDAGVRLVGDVAAALAEALPGLPAWDLVHLDEHMTGAAYVVTPDAAQVLLDEFPPELVPLEAYLARVELDGFSLAPVLAHPGPGPSADHVLSDHLVVVEALDVDARLASLADELAPTRLALVVPAGRARVLGSPGEVLRAYAECGAPPLRRPGPLVLARPALLTAAPELADVGGLHTHVDGRHPTTVALNGRLLDVVTGTRPVVVTTADEATLAALDAELADPGSRDLARLLHYDDAADPGLAAGLTEVAGEIVAVPFWTPAFCATVVRAAEAVGAFAADDHDPVPGHEISLAAISPRLFAHLEDDLAVRLLPLLQGRWPLVEYHGLRDAFVIKYAPGGQDELRLHHDVAQLSASLKLNEGYEGAELEFPRQGWSNADLPVGHLVVWPSLVTHPHRTRPLEAGVKYGLTVWFELPPGHEPA